MPAVENVAIVGAGIASLAAAIRLADAGIGVDIFEQREKLSLTGSGITLQGNALRALDQVGVWDEVRQHGYTFDGLVLRAPGPAAKVVAEIPEVATGGPEYPAGMGMYRPELAKIMLNHAQRLGVRIHFAHPVTSFSQSDTTVSLEIAGKPSGEFDLLIGADGLHSTVRDCMGITTVPEHTGMGIWRTVVSRPAEVTGTELYYGGPLYIAGYTPTSEDQMYAFLVEKAQDRSGLRGAEAANIMTELSHGYGGPWESIRRDLGQEQQANYTWFTHHIVAEPWNIGRVVIIGDAAHSCPPTVAQGAAQGLEDAVVLTELLTTHNTVSSALWDEFHRRRIPRARDVVECSVQLAQWQIDQDPQADAVTLISELAQRMAVAV